MATRFTHAIVPEVQGRVAARVAEHRADRQATTPGAAIHDEGGRGVRSLPGHHLEILTRPDGRGAAS